MAFLHGKDAAVSLNSQSLSAYTSSVEFSRDIDTADVSAFGDQAKEYIPGQTDATVSLEGSYDDTTSTGPHDFFTGLISGDAATTLLYQPEGTGTGLVQYSVSAIVTSYVESVPVSDKITWSAELQCTGAITITDQS